MPLLASLVLASPGFAAATTGPTSSVTPPPALLPKPSAVPGTGAVGRTLLTRSAPEAMGQNNGVRLWVHGDGSGATLQIRLLQTSGDAAAAGTVPTWVSSPVPLTFVGWHEVLLPKSKFTLRPDTTAAVDTVLPADAQDGDAPTPPASDWGRINALGLELRVPKRTAIIVDDVSWVTLDTSGAVSAETSVDDFENGNVAAWVPGGPPTQQQLLTYGLATQAGQAHGGRVAFKLDAVSPGFVRQTVQMAAVKKSLMTTGKPYIVFIPASRFEPILPSSLPSPTTTSTQLTIQVCPEQIQAATFCLYSQTPLQNVTVTIPKDLQAIGHILPQTNIDVEVVKVRDLAGAGLLQDPDTAGPVPELLVKDDRVPLAGTDTPIRLTGAPTTDVPADSTKQFWVTVSVPRGTAPGHYTGNMLVSGKGLAVPIPVRMDINVLPLRLLSPAKQYGIELRSRLDAPPATLPTADGRQFVTDFVTKPILDQQLADITSHGFRISTLYDSPATVWDAVDEYRRYGITDPYIYKGDGDPMTLEAARKDHGAPSFLYYADPDPVTQTQNRLAALNKGGLLATTYITRQSDYDALQANLEVPVYSRDSPYAQQLLKTRGQRQSSKRDWWYWPAGNSDPETDRLDTGFLLWRANLYGAFVPAYQTAFGADPYDDTSAGAPAAFAAYRPEMLTYPVQGGVLDTLSWEAAREGITDVRYLTTFYTALRECKDAKIAKPMTDAAEAYVKALLDKPLALLPDSELDKARAQIATYALQMRTTVDTYNKTHKVTQ
jgi:hypothetical protein